MSKQISANEVKEHNTVEKGLYIIIDNNVYEMGGFVDEHPGGAKILKRVGGKDASKQFWKVRKPNGLHTLSKMKSADWLALSQYHNENVMKKYQGRLKIGSLKEEAKL